MALSLNNIESCSKFAKQRILKNESEVACDSALPTASNARCARSGANAIQTCVYCPVHTVRRPNSEEKKLLQKSQ